jgi:hypothetical protein
MEMVYVPGGTFQMCLGETVPDWIGTVCVFETGIRLSVIRPVKQQEAALIDLLRGILELGILREEQNYARRQQTFCIVRPVPGRLTGTGIAGHWRRGDYRQNQSEPTGGTPYPNPDIAGHSAGHANVHT